MHQVKSERLNSLENLQIPTSSKIAVALFFITLLCGSIAAPWFFTWEGLWLAIGLFFLTQFGITVGYHRLLTHDSFETFSFVRAFLGLLGVIAFQSGPIDWVAYHREHHRYSDEKGDPHSPYDGFFWAHVLWIIYAFSVPREEREKFQKRYAPDLLKEPMIRFISKYHLYINMLFIGLILRLGLFLGGPSMMWSFLFWGIFLRTFFMNNVTWSVNSISHMWGYKNYKTKDNSRNNAFVGWLAGGEGWHNNHHGEPTAANHGQKWWEFDLSYKVILLMKLFGLAWRVKTFPPPPPLSEQK